MWCCKRYMVHSRSPSPQTRPRSRRLLLDQSGGRLEFYGVIPVPPTKAPEVLAKSIFCTRWISLCGSILCFFRTYSKTISGIPPGLPPITSFPIRSSHRKSRLILPADHKVPCALGKLTEIDQIVSISFIILVDGRLRSHQSDVRVAADNGSGAFIRTESVCTSS